MKVMSFDLSTSCIGVITAKINDNTKDIIKILSCPIIPSKFNPETLGYLKSKKKLETVKFDFLNCYAKAGETHISKAEKMRRDREVRGQKDIYVLADISRVMGNMINSIKPDLILVEKNVSRLNGQLTTVLLAKVMGTLLGISGMLGIPVKEYAVNKARGILDVPHLVKDFAYNHSPEELREVPDITKRAIREFMQSIYGKYGLVMQTDDEGDGCVVLNYWYKEEFGGLC